MKRVFHVHLFTMEILYQRNEGEYIVRTQRWPASTYIHAHKVVLVCPVCIVLQVFITAKLLYSVTKSVLYQQRWPTLTKPPQNTQDLWIVQFSLLFSYATKRVLYPQQWWPTLKKAPQTHKICELYGFPQLCGFRSFHLSGEFPCYPCCCECGFTVTLQE